ncbi:Gfo/Idh/MocA family protein [Kribbella sancticallisti]|uniref:Gfo/Idh/MocA family protein n=1 Tax=Kribbella sancticallisti TaxID=460087 RepID=UPI003CD09E5D
MALLGLGDIGLGAHLPALERHPAIEIALLADVSPERRRAATEYGSGPGRRGVPRYEVGSGLDDVLAAGVDGVVFATPPWVTPDLVVRAAQAGLCVLAEKPVATSIEAAAVYAQLSPAERARVQVGLTYRHDPAIQTLAGWIANGVLGTPLLVRAHIYDEMRRLDDVEHLERMHATLERGMPVIHEGAHVLDWLSYLLQGRPERIDGAWSLQTATDLPAPNLVGARLIYPGGHVALAEFGWMTDSLPRCEITVLGDRGYAVLDGTDFTLTLNNRELVRFDGEKVPRCFDRQVERFVALHTGGPAEPSLADGIAALRTAEEIATRASGESR